jgi:hypothetical protein
MNITTLHPVLDHRGSQAANVGSNGVVTTVVFHSGGAIMSFDLEDWQEEFRCPTKSEELCQMAWDVFLGRVAIRLGRTDVEALRRQFHDVASQQ